MSRIPPPPGNPADRRIAERAPVAIEADLRRPGRTSFKIALRDLSRTGCRAETVMKTVVGDRIWITLPGFAALMGIIRWRNARGFGCEWEAPIHPSVFDHIRAKYPDLLD